jgi:hypothetical protein
MSVTQLLTGDMAVCPGCNLKLELDRGASQRALAALHEFDWRLRNVGFVAPILKAFGAISGALYRFASILRSVWQPDLIVLGIGSGPARHPNSPPPWARQVLIARLGGLDCTLHLARGEAEGLRRLRELLELRS